MKKRPTPKIDDTLATLRAHGLQVERVVDLPNGPRIEWRKPPTEAERALVNDLLPGASHDS